MLYLQNKCNILEEPLFASLKLTTDDGFVCYNSSKVEPGVAMSTMQ